MIAALVVGGLTAWYFGVRAGVAAAVVSAALLLVAAVVPGASLAVWALVLAYAALVYFLGPRLGAKAGPPSVAGAVGKAGVGAVKASVAQATAWAKKLFGGE